VAAGVAFLISSRFLWVSLFHKPHSNGQADHLSGLKLPGQGQVGGHRGRACSTCTRGWEAFLAQH
jgi:hypothetical protein